MIVSSSIVWALPQEDGRIVVRESHVDDQGRESIVDYVAEEGTDLGAKLSERAEAMNGVA